MWLTATAFSSMVNRWLVPKLEGEESSEGYEHLYLARLTSLHLFEVATFLRQTDRFPEVEAFVTGLDAEAQDAYRALLAIGKGASGEFADQVEHARNNFSHYGTLLPDEAVAHENLRQAIKAHADEGTIGKILDTTPPITGFRALFADDIAAELTFPGGDKAETETFVEQVSEHTALFVLFARQRCRPTRLSFLKRPGKTGLGTRVEADQAGMRSSAGT